MNFFTMFYSCTFLEYITFRDPFYQECSIYALLKALSVRVIYLMTLSVSKNLYR